jgi:hypothetical protein
MANPSVVIDIAAEYTGKKAFKDASNATSSLEKTVKTLGKTIGITFSAKAIYDFSKASVKAFAEDDRAIRVLQVNLKNLGLAYQSVNADNFIAKMEKQANISDSVLRPAYAQLAKVTLSTTKTQDLMALAFDVSVANGLDFASTVDILSNAYVGNYKGLKQLYTGLTQAQLASKSFEEIQAILTKQSKGAGKASLDTYASSVDKLSIAADNAKESIGKGLVDLFAGLAGNGDIDQATANIDTFSKALGQMLSDASKYGALDWLSALVTGNVTEGTAQKLVKKPSARRFFTGGSGVSSELLAARKAAAAEAARIKAIKAAAAAKIAADKKAAAQDLALKKANSAFDLQSIQISAALKNTYDKDERLRLLALQEIENGNGEAALKYIEQLNLLTKEQQTNKLNGIKGITETELSSINTILMRDLEAIRISKMSEEDKAAARNEAYAKYNAAISESGGLAEANFYTEKTQAQLLAIAKIAALDDVSNAQTTLLNIAKIDQLDVIKIVKDAQASADAQKYAALQGYINLLKSIPQIPAIVQAPSIGAGGTTSNGGMGGNYTGDFTDYLPANPVKTNVSSSKSVTVVIQGNVLDGDDFTQKVNNALLNGQRIGYSQSVAGQLP